MTLGIFMVGTESDSSSLSVSSDNVLETNVDNFATSRGMVNVSPSLLIWTVLERVARVRLLIVSKTRIELETYKRNIIFAAHDV